MQLNTALYNEHNIVEKQAQKYWNASRAWRGLRQPDLSIRALIDVMTICHELGNAKNQRQVDLAAGLLDATVRTEKPSRKKVK